MKIRFLLALTLTAFVGVLPSSAQIVVSFVGATTGNTLPGSPTDYIFPDTSNYPFPSPGYSIDNGNAYSELSSFYLAGGVTGQGTPSSNSSITTPAGGSPIVTGSLSAFGTFAFGIEPGTDEAAPFATDDALNPNFNYNDFDVYVMYSNIGGALQDSTITLFGRYGLSTNGSTAEVTLGSAGVPADTNTNPSQANFLEFEVTGLGTAIADGEHPDLVVAATGFNPFTYIGAVSFESVPEPRIWAMLLGGIGILLGAQRLRRATRL